LSYNFYSSPNIIKSNPGELWVGNIEHMTKNRRAYKVSVENREGKRPSGRRRYKREDNIKMDHNEIEWEWSGFIWLGIGTSGWVF
jgi:hypothetical protein